jgi:DNA helicase-2/ATP-dependent DNA helicase PcrA
VTISFSELKYLFECPYSFKLRFLYGFNPPIHEALGYGKGLHDALSEVHKKAVAGELLDVSSAAELVERHLFTPFAYPELRSSLQTSAIAAIERYFANHGAEIPRTVHSEKQIQVHVALGITVDGRIDLIRRLDTDELAIVDFKSSDRAQQEDVTRAQLHVYAVGYEELTGEDADLIEVLNLDEEGKSTREEIEASLLSDVRLQIAEAGDALRSNNLPRLDLWCASCDRCDLAALCRDKPGA